MTEYADQRAHDVAWMTAAEREEYDRQLATLAPGYSPVVRGPLAALRRYVSARPDQWITEVPAGPAEADFWKCTEHRSRDLEECEPIHEARYLAVMAAGGGTADLDALVMSAWWADPFAGIPNARDEDNRPF